MQGSWRSKKWGYIVGPDTWPILATLVPIVGAAVSFFGFTSIWVLFHNPEVQILGNESEPYLHRRPQEHFVSRRRAMALKDKLERRMDAHTKPPNEPVSHYELD